jgi:hypothetical protein
MHKIELVGHGRGRQHDQVYILSVTGPYAALWLQSQVCYTLKALQCGRRATSPTSARLSGLAFMRGRLRGARVLPSNPGTCRGSGGAQYLIDSATPGSFRNLAAVVECNAFQRARRVRALADRFDRLAPRLACLCHTTPLRSITNRPRIHLRVIGMAAGVDVQASTQHFHGARCWSMINVAIAPYVLVTA